MIKPSFHAVRAHVERLLLTLRSFTFEAIISSEMKIKTISLFRISASEFQKAWKG